MLFRSQVPWTYRNRWLAALDTLRTMTFRVSHIYREGNSVADALASLSFDGSWISTIPQIQDQVARDLSDRPYFRLVQR